MSNTQKPTQPDGSPDELLGDLESIRELLDEERDANAAAPARDGDLPSTGAAAPEGDPAAGGGGDSQDPAGADPTGGSDEVPLLDDMIDGAYRLQETSDFLSATPVLGSGGSPRRNRYLREDVFEALLGDRWKTSTSDILTEARGAIEAHRNTWTPEDTDELNEALRIRIDETLTAWLRATLSERLDELHAELLRTAEAVIDEKIRALIQARTTELDDDTN